VVNVLAGGLKSTGSSLIYPEQVELGDVKLFTFLK